MIGVVLPVSVPVVAVTTWFTPLVVLAVKLTVAMPLASVTFVGDANDPPFVFDQVTI